MRFIKSIIIICLLVCSILALSAPAFATEMDEDVLTMRDMIEECVADENVSEDKKVTQLCAYFFENPKLFINAAAQTTADTNLWIIRFFAARLYFGKYPEESEKFPDVVYTMELSDFNTKESKAVYRSFRSAVWEYWKILKDENIDWNQVDWEIESPMDYFNTPYWRDLQTWLREETDISLMLYVSNQLHDTAAQTLPDMYFERFVADPKGMIRALALENAKVQENVMQDIVVAGAEYRLMGTPEAFGKFLGSIHLPQSATTTEKAILAEMIRRTKDDYGIDVPYTGDPIALSAAALLLSAAGTVCLKRKKTA